MIASRTFTQTGDVGNSTSSFSKEWLSMTSKEDNPNRHISFTLISSMDLRPGQYMLIIGAENYAVSYQRAVKLQVI
jgi:hypothetical protein